MKNKFLQSLRRRDFLKHACITCTTAAVSLTGIEAACTAGNSDKQKRAFKQKTNNNNLQIADKLMGKVVSVSNPKVFAKTSMDTRAVEQMVLGGIAALTESNDYQESLRELFSPYDVVGIKVNCLAGPGLSSSTTVVDAVVKGLRSIGIENSNIIIWERSSAELKKAGFILNRYSPARPLCFGNDEAGYGRKIHFSGETGSLWSNIISKKITKLINVPVVKDHDLAGVGCAMKNMYGAIHNPNRYHDNNCDPFVADVGKHPFVKDKLKLVVADGLTAQYHGGPALMRSHQWKLQKILVSTDPVAMDTIAKDIIEKKRFAKGLPDLKEAKRPPKWLKTANRYGLGECDKDKIKLIEM